MSDSTKILWRLCDQCHHMIIMRLNYCFILNTVASLLIIRRQICKVIRRFKFEELERDVIPIFPEISWSRIKSKLVKNHKNFTVTNAVRVIEESINVRTLVNIIFI